MKPFYAENRQQALELVKELLQPGQTVACGGSVTLDECGILQLLRSGDYHFLDRSAPGLTPEQSKGMLKQAFLADVYLLSANAITENGELYNVEAVGECMDCHSDGRICCNYLVSAQQRHQDRIKVILVGEELGY